MTSTDMNARDGVRNNEWTNARSSLIEELCDTRDDVNFAELADRLRELVPHRFFAYAVLRTTDGRIERLYNLDFPAQRLRSLRLNENSECKVIRKWLIKREPMRVADEPDDNDGLDAQPPDAADPNPLVIHAQLDLVGSRAIVFCLGDVPAPLFDRTSRELRVLTPYLYAAAVRSMRATAAPKSRYLTNEPLSPREVEVLRWVYHGKTNEEIAKILRISVFTVKNHIQRVLLKLNATNRVQAVLRACEAGLLGAGTQSVETAEPSR